MLPLYAGFCGINVLESRLPTGGYTPVGLRKVPMALVVFRRSPRDNVLPEGCATIGFRSCSSLRCRHTLLRPLRSRAPQCGGSRSGEHAKGAADLCSLTVGAESTR